MRKGWYKKAKKKWFQERLYEYKITHSSVDIEYNCYSGSKLLSYNWKGEVMLFLWKELSFVQDRFWWAWEHKGHEFGGSDLEVSYRLKAIEITSDSNIDSGK